MRKVTCRSHCAACGRHFGGDRAFDLHRAGSHRDGARVCLSPGVDTDRLELLTGEGWCRISGEHDDGVPRVLHPVQVWTAAGLAERRAALASLANTSSV